MNPIQLVITFDQQTGQIGVSGPIDNKMVCYGMLESARDAIRDYKPTEAPKILPIHGSLNGHGGLVG